MKAGCKTTIKLAKWNAIKEDIAINRGARARVGVLGSHATRSDSNETNADIGLWHEFGIPDQNLPERSWLRMPMIKALPSHLAKVGQQMFLGFIARNGIVKALKALGFEAESVISESFNSDGFGLWAPWSPAYAREREELARRKTGKENFIGAIDPGRILMRSGQLARNVSSQVVKP